MIKYIFQKLLLDSALSSFRIIMKKSEKKENGPKTGIKFILPTTPSHCMMLQKF